MYARLLSPVLAAVLGLAVHGRGTKPNSPATTANQDSSASWDGEWALLESESDKVEPLIEDHIKDQNFAMKLVWKRKLQASCKAFTSLDILAGESFSVTVGKELPTDTPTDGTVSEWKRSDGEKFQVSMRKDGPRITQTFQGDGFALTYVYSLRKDGKTLALQINYTNPKLNNPFSYKLVFKKSE